MHTFVMKLRKEILFNQISINVGSYLHFRRSDLSNNSLNFLMQ